MDEKTREIFYILQEECAEVIQAISKCFRFGLYDLKPGKELNNLQHLEIELGDLMAMINILIENNLISNEKLKTAISTKKEKLKIWSRIYENT
jgi:NTP pyrophosphatase (non-canonical NTP hydrolase)